MFVGDRELRTLELPWLDNKTGISCIPEGIYGVRYMERSTSGKYNRVYHVYDDPFPRQGILIHTGNLPEHTRGCILVGMKHGWLGERRAVLSSAVGLETLRRIMGKNEFKLVITSPKKLQTEE